ncbi:MAG: type II toxin-antitoxin system RelE/ParE family toxin [Magnetococcales bacterium]|nr:type II toxin-antitoxin system RelE/ParE family toxin [Magnetococcales bacterium]
MFEIAYSKQALRFLRRMPADQATLIRRKIAIYAETPEVLSGQVKKLEDRDGYRLRVGKWRVLFDWNGNVLEILKIGPRSSIYE